MTSSHFSDILLVSGKGFRTNGAAGSSYNETSSIKGGS